MAERSPRPLGESLARVLSERAPRTLLAEVQGAWPAAVGEQIAANSEPVSERDGVVSVACSGGAWAQELELMGDLLRERIEAIVGAGRVERLRFTADLARHR
jgi:predicted nucleic acid-binding Zn ribbon protein